ncbi:MAG: hypothetical protein WCG75_01010 [Armatimonadota bacterium]
MKIKSIALASVMMATATASVTALAQSDKSTTQLSWIGNTCPIRMFMTLNLEPSATGIVLCGDSNPVFLGFANALFNPREYTIDRVATVTTSDSSGRATHSMTVSPPESFRAILAGTTSLVGSGGSNRRTFSANDVHHNAMDQIVADELSPFFTSDDSTMLRLPPAVSGGVPVDPIGHIVCVVKTKTKSNQSNDRSSAHANETLQPIVDEISSQNVRILLQGGDGKGQMVVTPVSMGAMKLTKADVGRALDASLEKEKKIQSWVKDCYDRRTSAFDPSLTNVLQFDISASEAEKLSTQFQPGQSRRIKLKSP